MRRRRTRQVPGQEFVESVDRMIGDALQDVAQVELRIEPVKLSRPKQGVDGRSTFSTRV